MDSYSNEYQTMSSSRLRPPQKVQLPTLGLSEMTASDTNSRSMGPPALPMGQHSLKHKPTGLMEPEHKMARKTLAEQAGETRRANSAAPSTIRQVNPTVSRYAQQGPKSSNSFSSVQPAGKSLRNPGFAASVNGPRPTLPRTQSAMGQHSRSKSQHTARPATAFGHQRALSQSVQGQNPAAPVTTEAWGESGVKKRLEDFDNMLNSMKTQMEGTTFEKKSLQDIIQMQRDQAAELQLSCKNMNSEIESLREQLNDGRDQLMITNTGLMEQRWSHEIESDELERKHRYQLADMEDQHRKEVDRLRRDASEDDDTIRRQHREEIDTMLRDHRQRVDELERRFKAELDEEKDRRLKEVNEISMQRDEAFTKIATGIGEKAREADTLREDLRNRIADFEREKMLRNKLEAQLSEASANFLTLQSSNGAMRAKIEFLESDNQQQSQQFADLHRRMQDAIESEAIASSKLRAEESLRRKLHNQVQELKGNIRVFCRVRPPLGDEEDVAEIAYPDDAEESKEISVRGPKTTSAMGKDTTLANPFAFDRVFQPNSANEEIFEEISQLVQSALDGYNVCIFCYGQTGSGKTFTMSSPNGMIPRAVRQIFESATALEEKGWKYTMRGSFVEVYNEDINDLLGKSDDLDKKKHEVHWDEERKSTTITEVEPVELDSPEMVHKILKTADKNRSVAATKANMRSSRSHSVFILTIAGKNSVTGETCEGTLNLVDLAGSERVKHSQVEGQQLKETQNINKSLSCLGDVIGSLGKGGHVPYRNSMLTKLLRFSLGGNSKTLMFVMVSPLQAHLGETLTSLKFATKVHNTHIGTAKRQSKIGQ